MAAVGIGQVYQVQAHVTHAGAFVLHPLYLHVGGDGDGAVGLHVVKVAVEESFYHGHEGYDGGEFAQVQAVDAEGEVLLGLFIPGGI